MQTPIQKGRTGWKSKKIKALFSAKWRIQRKKSDFSQDYNEVQNHCNRYYMELQILFFDFMFYIFYIALRKGEKRLFAREDNAPDLSKHFRKKRGLFWGNTKENDYSNVGQRRREARAKKWAAGSVNFLYFDACLRANGGCRAWKSKIKKQKNISQNLKSIR